MSENEISRPALRGTTFCPTRGEENGELGKPRGFALDGWLMRAVSAKEPVEQGTSSCDMT